MIKAQNQEEIDQNHDNNKMTENLKMIDHDLNCQVFMGIGEKNLATLDIE